LFIQRSTGNVGIGNNLTPTSTLDVTGTLAVSGNATFDTSTLVVDAANNRVGIGTAAPISKVDVLDGTINVGNSTNVTQTNNLFQGYGYILAGTPIGITRITSTYSNVNNSASLEFYTDPTGAAPTERMRITSEGNVGIGTTSPSVPLQVAGGTSIYNGAATTGAISAGQQEVITTGFNLDAGQSVDISTIAITSATSWKAIVVGGYANNIEGGGLISPSLEVELDNSSATIAVGSVSLLFSRNGTTGKLQVANSSGSGRVTFVGKIQVINYSQSVVPTVSKIIRGNVGIGTSAPAQKLHVWQGNSGTSARTDLGGTIIAEGSTRAGLYILTAGTDVGSYGSIWWGNGNANTDASIQVNNSTRAMSLITADGERMRITSTGNVGIGTTAPLAKLDVRTTSTTNAVIGSFVNPSTANNTTKTASISLGLADTAGDIKDAAYLRGFTGNANVTTGGLAIDVRQTDAAPTEVARFTPAGNVLIGTTSDNGAKLQVNGTANATQFISTTGTVVAPLSTPTTFFTATSQGIYLAHVYLGSSNTQVWSATIFFAFNASNILVINQTNGTNVSTSVSGTDVLVTQIGGASFTMGFDIIKIA
jgi:hypothetical protein